jgi:hypothetical protein
MIVNVMETSKYRGTGNYSRFAEAVVGVQDDIHGSTSDNDHDRLAGIEI